MNNPMTQRGPVLKSIDKEVLRAGDTIRLREALEEGGDPNASQPHGWTALMNACALSAESPGMARLLIRYGADVNAADSEGRTALMTACCGNDTKLVRFLIEAGADAEMETKDGKRAVSFAAQEGPDVFAYLMDLGVRTDVATNTGQTLFLLAAASRKSPPEALARLRENGADIHAADDKGVTALISAVCGADIEKMKLLLEMGLSPDTACKNGKTPLMFAAQTENSKKCPAMVKMLLEYGADVSISTSDGRTALLYAAGNGRTAEATKLLVDAGADRHLKNSEGLSPLGKAIESLSPSWEFLAAFGDTDIDMADGNGNTALMRAIDRKNFKVAQVLIALGANLLLRNRYGSTALDFCMQVSCAGQDNEAARKQLLRIMKVREERQIKEKRMADLEPCGADIAR